MGPGRGCTGAGPLCSGGSVDGPLCGGTCWQSQAVTAVTLGEEIFADGPEGGDCGTLRSRGLPGPVGAGHGPKDDDDPALAAGGAFHRGALISSGAEVGAGGGASGAGPDGAVTLEGGGASRTGPAGAVAVVKGAVVESFPKAMNCIQQW
jgi:hypothetical protein